MDFDFDVVPATFVERPNRFLVRAQRVDTGERVEAHCPNPGRMRELLVPGATLYLSLETGPGRRTPYTLRFAVHPESGQLVSLTTQLPNGLFREALEMGLLPPLSGYTEIAAEVPLPLQSGTVSSRIDFRLTSAQDPTRPPCWVETKSVTLVEEGVGLFPDAPTERGRRHVEELAQVVERGHRAAVVFVVQRPDAHRVRPHWETDPRFAQTLVDAVQAGVETYAFTCRVTLGWVRPERAIPVGLTP